MYNSNDEILFDLKPKSLDNDRYIENIEEIIDEARFHSDEVSETDDDKTQQEIEDNIRPKNKKESDKHVICVYDKPWRSRRVCINIKILRFDLLLIYSYCLNID